jgi:hypothetical protein
MAEREPSSITRRDVGNPASAEMPVTPRFLPKHAVRSARWRRQNASCGIQIRILDQPLKRTAGPEFPAATDAPDARSVGANVVFYQATLTVQPRMKSGSQ